MVTAVKRERGKNDERGMQRRLEGVALQLFGSREWKNQKRIGL